MSLARQIRRYAPAMAAIVVLCAMAAGVGLYVLAHQRVVFPWQHRYTLNIELTSAQALTPGQGQTVDVAGVAVGSIESVRVHADADSDVSHRGSLPRARGRRASSPSAAARRR